MICPFLPKSLDLRQLDFPEIHDTVGVVGDDVQAGKRIVDLAALERGLLKSFGSWNPVQLKEHGS